MFNAYYGKHDHKKRNISFCDVNDVTINKDRKPNMFTITVP